MIEEVPARLKGPLCVDLPLPMAVMGNDYRFKSANKRWVDLFGWSDTELDGSLLVELVETQRDAQELDRKILLMINAYAPYEHLETVMKTKLNDPRKVLLRMFSVFDDDRGGKFDYALIYAIDQGGFSQRAEDRARVRRLWPYIIITTTALWFADFGELFDLGLSMMTGGMN